MHWLEPRAEGLFCVPGGFFVDPVSPVERALITHGHADHARAGNAAVLATEHTLAIMRVRYAGDAARTTQVLEYGRKLRVGDVDVTFYPAGHVLGSAQVLLEHAGARVLITGDFKRRADPTCAPFELVKSDLLITEATFGLPIFRHPRAEDEVSRLLESLALFPERAHLVGVYALGKCQRFIALLRAAGWDRPIWIHGALAKLCALYSELGVELGELRAATGATKEELAGQIVLAPPSALGDRWTRRLPDPVAALASGWMAIRARARQRGVELPLVISDHADWDELLLTIADSGAREVWVTHGLADALVYETKKRGVAARALELRGYEEEEEA